LIQHEVTTKSSKCRIWTSEAKCACSKL